LSYIQIIFLHVHAARAWQLVRVLQSCLKIFRLRGGGHAEDKMRGNFTAAGGFYGCGWLNLLDGALNSYSTPQELNSDTIYIYKTDDSKLQKKVNCDKYKRTEVVYCWTRYICRQYEKSETEGLQSWLLAVVSLDLELELQVTFDPADGLGSFFLPYVCLERCARKSRRVSML